MNANLFAFLGMDHFFTKILYNILMGILSVVDFVHEIFNVITGIEEINVDGESSSLLDFVLRMDTIQQAFIYMIVAGMIFLVLITIISVFRNIPNEKKSPGKVVGQALYSTVLMFGIGAMLIVGIMFANAMLVAVSKLLPGGNSKISELIFWLGNPQYANSGYDYTNFESMWGGWFGTNVFDDYNWFTTIVGGCTMLVILALAAFNMIKRLYDLVLLLLIAPLAVSTIPGDDGAKFKAWRDVTIGKVFAAYGTVFAFNVFFLVVPIISNITVFNDGLKDGLFQLFMLIGGGLAVSSSSLIVSQILGTGGLEGREMANSFRTLMAGGMLSKNVIGGIRGAKQLGMDGNIHRIGGLFGSGGVASSLTKAGDNAGKLMGGHRYTGARDSLLGKSGSVASNLRAGFMKSGGLGGIMAGKAVQGVKAMGKSGQLLK